MSRKELFACAIFIGVFASLCLLGCGGGGGGGGGGGPAGNNLSTGSISGSVSDNGVYANVKSNILANGLPLNGVTLYVEENDTLTSTSGADGSFVITGVPANGTSYHIIARIQHPNSGAVYMNRSAAVTVSANQTSALTTNIEILKADRNLSGVVKDSSGAPLPGATIKLWGKTHTTGSDGSFSISNHPPVQAELTISSTGKQSQTVTETFGSQAPTQRDFSLQAANSTNTPPTISLTASPLSTNPGGSITLTATGQDINNDMLTYTWESPSLGTLQDGNASNIKIWGSPTGQNSATTIAVKVTDGKGGEATAKIAVKATQEAPQVLSVSPVNGAQNISISSPIVITFSQTMNTSATDGAVNLKDGSVLVTGTKSWNSPLNNVITFTPVSLSGNKTYTLEIAVGAKSISGTSLSGTITTSFSTSDTTQPTISNVSPANGATQVMATTTVIITFSKAMNQSATQAAFSLTDGSTTIPGAFSWNSAGNTMTFTPSATLGNNKTYTVSLTTGSKDQAGNALAAIYSSTFTTNASSIQVPTEFAPPSGYSTVGFPAVGSSISIANFSNSQKAGIILVNRSASAVIVSLSGNRSVNSAISPIKQGNSSLSSNGITRDQAFHKTLRDAEKLMPPSGSGKTLANKVQDVRADVVGQQVAFTLYPSGTSVSATCRKVSAVSGSGGNVNFYFDNLDIYNTSAQTMVDALDQAWGAIYSKNREIFGAEPPANFNGVNLGNDISILLSSRIDTAGYFYSGDLYLPSQIQGGISNQRKMFYLQYNPTKISATSLSSTMAHEFQHMINFYQRKLNNVTEEDWLNEGFSGYAEHINGYKASTTNQSKAIQINEFFSLISATSLTNWAGGHANYGQVYLFGTWLGQNFGSNGVVKTLLSSQLTGQAAIAAFTGQTFDKIFGQWILALYVNNTQGGIYGYSDIDLKGTYSYGANLADQTLTGPKLFANFGALPYSTGNITISSYAAAYVELTGGNSSALNLTLPTSVSAFEIHK